MELIKIMAELLWVLILLTLIKKNVTLMIMKIGYSQVVVFWEDKLHFKEEFKIDNVQVENFLKDKIILNNVYVRMKTGSVM